MWCASIGTYSFGEWTELGQTLGGRYFFGSVMAMNEDGSVLAVGDYLDYGNDRQSGAVQVFRYSSGTWAWLGGVIGGDGMDADFGFSVSLSADGTVLGVGAPHRYEPAPGYARVYQFTDGKWTQVGADLDGQEEGSQFGYLVALSGDGRKFAIGAIGTNAVQIYETTADGWRQVYEDLHGSTAVAMSKYGTVVAVAVGSNQGTVRIFRESSLFEVTVAGDGNAEGWARDGSVVTVARGDTMRLTVRNTSGSDFVSASGTLDFTCAAGEGAPFTVEGSAVSEFMVTQGGTALRSGETATGAVMVSFLTTGTHVVTCTPAGVDLSGISHVNTLLFSLVVVLSSGSLSIFEGGTTPLFWEGGNFVVVYGTSYTDLRIKNNTSGENSVDIMSDAILSCSSLRQDGTAANVFDIAGVISNSFTLTASDTIPAGVVDTGSSGSFTISHDA